MPHRPCLSAMWLVLAACGSGGGDGGRADAASAPGEDGSRADAARDPCAFPSGATTGARVHVVYLVPADREEVPAYTANLAQAIRQLQVWYGDQTGGDTFEVNAPVVEVLSTSHAADFYATHDAGGDAYLRFWDNTLADAFPLTGGGFNDPEHIWLYYIDADNGCNQIGGGGTSGVAVLPANDLRGLTDEPRIRDCPDEQPDTQPRCRWVGGLGHELGHAFGLGHPPACEDASPDTVCPDDALLWTGYTVFPDAHLTSADLDVLAASPFFAPRPALPTCALDCAPTVTPE
ncbi:MAG TPA: hypothetical protein VMZ28_30620 [Kofleriaceae bacterium]|nr:hypothetical protein [Kofleriaceae bacterium]